MRTQTLFDYESAVRQVIAEILEHCEGPLRLEQIAERAGFSPFHFTRVFSGIAGEPLIQLARRVRLERAAYRLRHTDATVTELAHESGFESLEAFGRAFRSCFGCAPLAYRQAGGHASLLPSPSGVHWHPDDQVRLRRPLKRNLEMIQPKIIPFGAKRVAAYRHVGESPGIDRSWAKLKPLIAERGLDSRYFTRCYDGPETAPDQTQYDLCFTVPPNFEPFDGLKIDELPAGEYAVFVHQGPDDLIVDTWSRAFTEWLPQSGRKFDDVAFEEYVNGFYLRPELPDEKLIVTAVYLKLA